jgi:hypothetical protein
MFLFVALALVMIVSLIWVAVEFARSPGPEDGLLSNPVGMVDRLDFFDTPARWTAGTLERVKVLDGSPPRIGLSDPRGRFPRSGSWTSAEVTAAVPFTELIPSYNPSCPPETGLRIDVRTRDVTSAKWSPWFYLGCWGRTIGKDERIITDAAGKVDVDTLVLNRPADAYQVRITLYAFNLDEQVNPALRRLAVSYSGIANDPAKRDLVQISSNHPPACDIPVPFRAQGNAAKPLRPEICSPTSVSMVMQYLGLDRPTEENALAIYDAEYGMFGNWSRAVAWAGQNGFDAWLTRFRNWDQVRATIASGQPIIASIRFKKGQCPSFVMQETAGHLIVIRGTTPDGDLIVNDPASRDKGNGAVYRAEDLAKAWLAHGGVGYIIKKAAN